MNIAIILIPIIILVLIIVIRRIRILAVQRKELAFVRDDIDRGEERGTISERLVICALLRSGINSKAIFHDLYIHTGFNNFSQIDLVVPTSVGIIVFEVKDYSGWIFGNGKQTKWTQVLAYGREKYRFYNPIMQNATHINVLKQQLQKFDNIPFYSVIVFYGDCELKEINFVPEDTYITSYFRVLDVVNNILNNNPPANYTDKRQVINALQSYANNGANEDVRNQHIRNIRNNLGTHRIFE